MPHGLFSGFSSNVVRCSHSALDGVRAKRPYLIFPPAKVQINGKNKNAIPIFFLF